MYKKAIINIIFAVVYVGFCGGVLVAEDIEFDNGLLKLTFRDSPLALTRIAKVGDTEAEFCAANENTRLFILEFRNELGQMARQVSSSDFLEQDIQHNISADGNEQIEFLFSKLSGAEYASTLRVRITIELFASQAKSAWKIETSGKLNDTQFLHQVHFPILPQVSEPGQGDVLFPIGNYGGRLYRNNRAARFAAYPGFTCFTQLAGFFKGENALAFYSEDTAVLSKDFILSGEQDFMVRSIARGHDRPDASAGDFSFVIELLKGNYYDVAKCYRRWAEAKAPWLAKGKLSLRDDVPRNFLNLGGWALVNNRNFPELIQITRRIGEKLQLPLGIHWYEWHVSKFDYDYPDLVPSAGFAQSVKAMQNNNALVMPYVNGHLYDPALASYAQLESAVIKRGDSRGYFESWGEPKHDLAGMCPGSELFRKKLSEVNAQLILDHRLNMLYLDQISAVERAWCFDKSHGHIPGAGSYYDDGYRAALEDLRAKTKHEVALTSECAQEVYIDVLDGFLTWLALESEDVPLLPAIYSGYTTYFGSPAHPQDDFGAFAASQLRGFLWGIQLGWSREWLGGDPQFDHYAEYWRELCRLRLQYQDFFVFGELLGELNFEQELRHYESTQNFQGSGTPPRQIRTAEIMSALWRAENGDVAIFVANTQDAAITFSGTFAVASETMEPLAILDGELVQSIICDDEIYVAGALAPYEVRVYKVIPLAKVKSSAKNLPLLRKAFDAGKSLRIAPQSFGAVEGGAINYKVIAKSTDGSLEEFCGTAVADAQNWCWLDLNNLSENSSLLIPSRKFPGQTVDFPRYFRVKSAERVSLPIELINYNKNPVSMEIELLIDRSWQPQPSAKHQVLVPGGSRIIHEIVLTSPESERAREYNARFNITANGKEFGGRLKFDLMARRPGLNVVNINRSQGMLPRWVAGLGAAKPSSIKLDGYGGNDDLSLDLALGYDAEHLYLQIDVTDDKHEQTFAGGELWKGDMIQLAFYQGENMEQKFTGNEREFAFALGNDGKKSYDFGTNGEVIFLWDVDETQAKNKLRYWIELPFELLDFDPENTESGLCFSLAVADNDGKGFRGWLELTSGVFGVKDSGKFMKLNFISNK